MSCFEQSVFLQRADILNQVLLTQVCNTLGWKIQTMGIEVWVYPKAGVQKFSISEPVLKVRGNTIIWNTYTTRTGAAMAETLRTQYMNAWHEFRVQVALEAVRREFTQRGFTFLEDHTFTAGEEEKHRFYMKGRSRNPKEAEPVSTIRFTILKDGTIRTSSDFIPEDVHILADEAMESLENMFGQKRKITPKEIPAKYQGKTFCHAKPSIQLKQNKK